MIDSYSIKTNKKSRLSCQIEVTNDLDGLIVTTPEKQVNF